MHFKFVASIKIYPASREKVGIFLTTNQLICFRLTLTESFARRTHIYACTSTYIYTEIYIHSCNIQSTPHYPLPVLLGGCPSFLLSLPTCVMYSIGCLYLSGYSIASLQWSPVVSLAAPPLTSASSAAQCRFWLHVGCCVLLRGVSFWSLVPVWLLCSEGPFRLWVHQHGMISPLSCVPC